MTEQDILAQAYKDVQDNAHALANILDMAGIECIVETNDTTKVCPLFAEGIWVELHICGTIVVWGHGCGVSHPDLIDAACAIKRLVT